MSYFKEQGHLIKIQQIHNFIKGNLRFRINFLIMKLPQNHIFSAPLISNDGPIYPGYLFIEDYSFL